jgi:L-rhamnose isomerase
VSYTIIYIPTKSSSNEVKSFVVVFKHLQLTLGRVVECSRDHVRLLDDLPNSTTLAQEIVVSLIFLVTKILAIKNH